MKAFIAVVLALVASASATVFTTGFSGFPVSTVAYNPGFAYTNSFAPLSTVSTFGGFSRPIYTNNFGYNTGFSNFGLGYRPFNTFNTGFASPYLSTFFKK